jgi:hypothetical protein
MAKEFALTLKAKGWNSVEFSKYFKKGTSFQRIRSNNFLQSQNLPKASEQPSIQTDYVLKPESALYGDGPIVNTFPRFLPAINQYYYKACAALGIPFNPVRVCILYMFEHI